VLNIQQCASKYRHNSTVERKKKRYFKTAFPNLYKHKGIDLVDVSLMLIDDDVFDEEAFALAWIAKGGGGGDLNMCFGSFY